MRRDNPASPPKRTWVNESLIREDDPGTEHRLWQQKEGIRGFGP